MVRRFLVTTGQLILVLIILVFVGYRVALIFDWVPEDFSPKGIMYQEYLDFKADLEDNSGTEDFASKMSLLAFNSLNRFEKYIREQIRLREERAKIEEQCAVDDIARFFMFLGSEKGQCVPQNLPAVADPADVKAKPAPKPMTNAPQIPNTTPITTQQPITNQQPVENPQTITYPSN